MLTKTQMQLLDKIILEELADPDVNLHQAEGGFIKRQLADYLAMPVIAMVTKQREDIANSLLDLEIDGLMRFADEVVTNATAKVLDERYYTRGGRRRNLLLALQASTIIPMQITDAGREYLSHLP